jgi:hypothetical protein
MRNSGRIKGIAMTAKYVATYEQMDKLARRQADLFRRVSEGTLPAHNVLADLQRIIEGGSTMVDCDAAPFIPEGWEVRPADQLPGRVQGQVDATKLGLYLPEEQQSDGLIGHELRKKLEGKPVLPANVLDYLYENEHLIPEEWKDTTVYFWGTVYRDRGGIPWVCYLYWDGGGCRLCRGEWCWNCNCLSGGWLSGDPAAVLAS